MWVIYSRVTNNYGDLIVEFRNITTREKHESIFSEGEHYQLEFYLEALNETNHDTN